MNSADANYGFFTNKSMTHGFFNEILLRHMEWFEAADLSLKGMEGAIIANM
ncbi:MAG: hypothetical protein LKI85_17215 [Enterobacter sp.]|jgi:hypothetical protein|nr:hypothetical protein [Enterobacter sp.]